MDNALELKAERYISDRRNVGYKHDDMRQIELPDAPPQPRRSYHEPVVSHHATKNQCGGVSRNVDEEISSVAETVVACCNPIDRIVRNVIEEYRPVGDATKQIETHVSPSRR
jgi:hypothetical protein